MRTRPGPWYDGGGKAVQEEEGLPESVDLLGRSTLSLARVVVEVTATKQL